MATIYIPKEIDRRVRVMACNRCGYCLSPQHLVMARLEIEHILPISKGGSNDESNLWLACPLCNRYKSDKTIALDPSRKPLYRSLTRVLRFGANTFSGAKMVFALSDEPLLVGQQLLLCI